MLSLPHILVAITVFSFMMTVVNFLPAIVNNFQERYLVGMRRTTRELDRFFVQVKATHILIVSLFAGAGLGYLLDSGAVGITIALTGVVTPKLLLNVWKGIRSRQFEAQLMDALILINNALKSGLDIAMGIELVATNLKPPVSQEFALVLNAYRLGTPLEEALTDMTKRIQSKTLDTAIGAIVIQRETGGNLIRTFEQLIQTIRDESKLQQKIQAISSQGRTQIAFLAVFPWAVAAAYYFFAGDMVEAAFQTSWGSYLLVGLVIWEGLGLLLTKKIVTIDV
jgi:tight adherence protein B